MDILIQEPVWYGGQGSGADGVATSRETEQFAGLAKLQANYEQLEWVQKPLSIWWVQWSDWRSRRTGNAANSSVALFLQAQPQFARHVVLSSVGVVTASRFQATFKPLQAMDGKLSQMHACLDACKGLGFKASASEMGFLWFAR